MTFGRACVKPGCVRHERHRVSRFVQTLRDPAPDILEDRWQRNYIKVIVLFADMECTAKLRKISNITKTKKI